MCEDVLTWQEVVLVLVVILIIPVTYIAGSYIELRMKLLEDRTK